MTEDRAYRMVVKVGESLWPLRPIAELASRYHQDMNTTEPPVSPPDPEPEQLFCPMCYTPLVDEDWQRGTGTCPVCKEGVGGITMQDIEKSEVE